MKNDLELLAPAGSYEAFNAALEAGADAVYVGGSRFGARAYAKNFTEEELLRAIDYAHLFGKKVYMTVNTLVKEEELGELYLYLKPYYEAGLDAVIVQDLGAIAEIRRCYPDLDIHASTQMAITSKEGVLLMEDMGIKQVVPARELSLKEIRYIKEHTLAKMECFIHGAICYSYSGKCLFSSLIGGRSGNRGRCAQPCRLAYDAIQNDRKINGKEEQYLLSMKDMCTIELLPELIEAGITSFKIEGRMKRPEYVAGVTRMYRKYIDLYLNLKEGEQYHVAPEDYDELIRLYSRGDSSRGYYMQKNGRSMLTLQKPSYETDQEEKFAELYETYVNHTSKIPVQAEILLRKNESARLRLDAKKESVEVTGDLVEEARNMPLSQENILKQLHKMGNTFFTLEEVRIDADDDIFMPVKQLNDLRRNAIDTLLLKLIGPARRSVEDQEKEDQPEKNDNRTGVPQQHSETFLSASVETMKALQSLCKIEEVRRIYISYADMPNLEEAIYMAVQSRKEVFLALPVICRHYEGTKRDYLIECLNRSEISGVSVQNYEWVYLLQQIGYQGEIVADYYLYTMNHAAREQLHSFGCRHFTVPLELNEKEIWKMNRDHYELLIYGYLPMMVTAQCIKNTMEGCNSGLTDSHFSLVDRYQKKLHVKNCCSECYNVIYNSVPLSLHHELTKIKEMNFESLRLSFTDETAEEVSRIANWYVGALSDTGLKKEPPFKEFTKGHFSRGVE